MDLQSDNSYDRPGNITIIQNKNDSKTDCHKCSAIVLGNKEAVGNRR